MSIISQTRAVIQASLQSLGYRWRLALSTITGIALVVMVLLGFLAMSEGFRQTLNDTGSADIAMIKSKGAKSETMSWIEASQTILARELPGVRHDGGLPMTSAEIYRAVNLPDIDGEKITLGLRGIDGEGLNMRPTLSISQGRAFVAGNRELLVGDVALRRYPQLKLGEAVTLAGAQWQVVGAFSVDQGLYGAEIWTDADSLRGVYGMGPGFNVMRVALASGNSSEELLGQLRKDPRMADIDVVSEEAFYSSQSQGVVKIIELIGWPIAILMALGAIAGAINTMHNSVEAQKRDIGTLRVLGFGRVPIFIAVMVEALTLVLIGGAIGTLLSLVLFNGLEGTTMSGSQSQLTFAFSVSAKSIISAMILAISVGLLGGLIPAIQAARKSVLDGLRE